MQRFFFMLKCLIVTKNWRALEFALKIVVPANWQSWQAALWGDSTHGSLALKAYQQNLYLEYYY